MTAVEEKPSKWCTIQATGGYHCTKPNGHGGADHVATALNADEPGTEIVRWTGRDVRTEVWNPEYHGR